ncbi:ABC transporter permease [Pseudoroseicyclus tamaricis]|uniref:Transport permease protein n=1 Tax=Pseudoroseicyclus tamaricis TaxID=2705421 RepID=A0A6B2K655_9RHOB|nr:ABC transporter permease [Pseudoroseicyclus tamaricis]NDV02326.1 ABC transporter permease [Pseudoroseicyclus tamaricis]
MNGHAVATIYKREMQRFRRTIVQSLVAPVISTSLYFVVFGAAIGSRIDQVEGVSYGAYIVPGLIMLTVMMQGTTNSAIAIYFPKYMGAIYEMLAAPVNFFEVTLGLVGAAMTKALIIGTIILGTSFFFVEISILHPFAMVGFLLLTCLSFALLGFIIGIWANSFEQLNLVPQLILTPLIFLGGSFYSASMLPPFWQGLIHLNPVFYLISGFRWSFFGQSDVAVGTSLFAIAIFTAVCLGVIAWIFRTGWRLRA